MNPTNVLLSKVGLRLARLHPRNSGLPPAFVAVYRAQLARLRAQPSDFQIVEEPCYDVGDHPAGYVEAECAFASRHLGRLAPATVLDVGSYRHFILGLLAHFAVTTIDVRRRDAGSERETVITSDAKSLNVRDACFPAVVSLCSIEHFGLGRYGDAFDLDADRNAIDEMKRVLEPGGHLILSTTITAGRPAISFNAHRIYSRGMVHRLCDGLELEDEAFFSQALGRTCHYDEVVSKPSAWDVYLGCWRKPPRAS